MAAYGEAALYAVKVFRQGNCERPEQAWRLAVEKFLKHSLSAQKKSCPRGTFLGLCGSGVIDGIPAGNYTRSTKNKEYGLRALEILRRLPALADNEKALWDRVIASENKHSNSQIEVVIALWKSGLIVR